MGKTDWNCISIINTAAVVYFAVLSMIMAAKKISEVTNLTDGEVVNVRAKCLLLRTERPGVLRAALADSTGGIILRSFHKHKQLVEGKSVLLINTTVKSGTITANNKTTVVWCGEVSTTEASEAAATKLWDSSSGDTEVSSLQSALSPSKKLHRIKGRVVKVSPKKERSTPYNTVALRHVLLQDKSALAKVALWRAPAEGDIAEGQVISVTHAVYKPFQEQDMLQTTRESTLEVVEDAELSNMAENPDVARYDLDSDFTTKTYIEALLIGVEYVYVYQSCNAHKKKLSPDGQCVKCSDSVPPSTSPACVAKIAWQIGEEVKLLTLFTNEVRKLGDLLSLPIDIVPDASEDAERTLFTWVGATCRICVNKENIVYSVATAKL